MNEQLLKYSGLTLKEINAACAIAALFTIVTVRGKHKR